MKIYNQTYEFCDFVVRDQDFASQNRHKTSTWKGRLCQRKVMVIKMYTALIVDDEEELRRAIIEKVDWKGSGFEVIGDAGNGIDALELAERLEPDLILTDIRMPMMTGLELARQVRELRPATQVVILSGYDDFSYAQTAIQYNIIGYLLKPISSSELTEELKKIRARMDRYFAETKGGAVSSIETERRMSVTEFLLPILLGNGEDSPTEERLRQRASELGLCAEDKSFQYGVIAAKFKNTDKVTITDHTHIDFVNNILRKYLGAESFLVNGRIVSLVYSDSGNLSELLRLPSRELVQSAERMLTETCTIGISRPFGKLSQCGSAYFEAITARRYTIDGAGPIRSITDQEHSSVGEFDTVEKSVYKLEQLLKVGTDAELEEFLRFIGDETREHHLNYLVIQVLATVYRTVSAVSDKEALSELIRDNPVYGRAAFYDSEPNVQNDLERLCRNARAIISRYQKQSSELLCDEVVGIIDKEYANESLSLTDISERLYVSPNYLSSLIKKYKKVNFTGLVTERRMRAAADMLVCTQMKILEIAEKCGYSDQHYFSYCFKKYYGMTPMKMREGGRRENSG